MASELFLTSRRFSGKLGDSNQKYSSTYAFSPVKPEEVSRRGSLFLVVDISTTHKLDLTLASKLLFDAVVEEYYSISEASPMVALETAVHAGKKRLEAIAFAQGSPSNMEVELNLAAVVVWEQYIYVARMGNVSCVMVRGGIYEEVGDSNVGTITTASGKFLEDETFVVGSKGFGKALPPEKLLGALPGLKRAADDLAGEYQDSQETPSTFSVSNAYPIDFSVIILDIEKREENDSPAEPEIKTVEEEVREEISEGHEVVPHVTSRPLSSTKENPLKKGINKIKSPFARFSSKVIPKPPPIYVKRDMVPLNPYGRKNSKWVMIGLVSLLLLFVASVFWTINKKRITSNNSEAVSQIGSAQENIKKATELIDLNNARAREFLKMASENIEDVEKLTKGKSNSEVSKLKKQLAEISDKVNKVGRIDDPQVYYDLASSDNEAQPSALTGSSTLFIIDKAKGVLYRLNLVTDDSIPSVDKTTNENLKDVRSILAGSNKLYGVANSGLVTISLSDSQVATESATLPVGWPDVLAAESYGDALYFITNNNQIYRMAIEGTTLSEGKPWLSAEISLTDATSLAIDGDVFITRRDQNDVVKLVSGEVEEWKIRELDIPFKNPSKVFTTVDSQYLYIADPGNKRVVVVTKEGGLYNRQFIYTGGNDKLWIQMQDLWVDETTSTIYLLDGTRVYKIKF